MGGPVSPGLYMADMATARPSGGSMGSLIVGPAIGAGASIAQGLIGKHASNNAAKAQQRANDQAIALQREQLADQRKVDQYGMEQAAAVRARNQALTNGLLTGAYGVRGLPAATYDHAPFSAPVPVLNGQAAPRVLPAPVARPPITLGGMAGGAPVAQAASVAPPPMTLGTMFGPRRY